MFRKIMILGCLIFLLLSFNASLFPSRSSAANEGGYALLDSLVVTFKELAEKGVASKTSEALNQMMGEAWQALFQRQIDDVFFKRYSRILMVLKLVIMPKEEGILEPVITREINEFIEDIEGEKFDLEDATPNQALKKLSEAVAHEVVNLRVYLDSQEDRKKLTEQYQNKMAISKEASEWLEQKERQLYTMKDIATINTALNDYSTDHKVPPKQAGIYDLNSEIYKALVPYYVKVLPSRDKWENNFMVYCGIACNGIYAGIAGCDADDILIASFGRDGKKENWKYDPKNPKAGIFELKGLDDFDKDLIIWNGSWLRAPMPPKKK
mgnify:CR=1 FL=1